MSIRWPLTFALVCQTIGSFLGVPCGLTVEMLIPGHGWVVWHER